MILIGLQVLIPIEQTSGTLCVLFRMSCCSSCPICCLLKVIVVAMLHYPDVMRKAQAELDAVVGPHRLPDFSDMPSLPYLRAIVKELLRWRVVVPLGVPHRSLEDDEYRGYVIPKGSLLVANIW